MEQQPQPTLPATIDGLVPSHLPAGLSEFVAAAYPPLDDKPVLGIRVSSHNACHFELMTVRYQPDYRPSDPWRTLDGDSVRASGNGILGWKNAMRWFHAL